MVKTNAEYQREHRQRRSERMAALAARCERQDAEIGRLTAALEAALAQCERLEANAGACRHPVELVENGTCRGCGADVW